MYIRRKVFSLAVDQETGEEKLFSTTDYLSQKEFSEKKPQKDKDTKAEKVKTAGKVIAGTGAATYIGAQASAAKTGYDRAKAVQKIAEKTGTINIGGNGVNKPAQYFGGNVEKAVEMDKRHLGKAAKVLKRSAKASMAGLGLAAAGAGTYLYGKHKAKKGEDQKK